VRLTYLVLLFCNGSSLGDDENSKSSDENSASGSQSTAEKTPKRGHEQFKAMLDLREQLSKEEALANQSGKKAKEEAVFTMYETFLKAVEKQVEAPEGEDTADHWFIVDCQVRLCSTTPSHMITTHRTSSSLSACTLDTNLLVIVLTGMRKF
jgi:hypothetical protein